jgi:Flp pilus assembly protein TadG
MVMMSKLAIKGRQFAQRDNGAAAVEFAFVSLPFILLLLAIIQIVFTAWANQNLDEAVQQTVRRIYTGDFQASSKGSSASAIMTALKADLCGTQGSRVPTAFSCSDVKIDVVLSSSFGAGSAPTPVDQNTGTWSTGFGSRYQCAPPASIVVVTVAVRQPVAFKVLNIGAISFSDGSRLLQSTVVIRTEPYDTSSGSSC